MIVSASERKSKKKKVPGVLMNRIGVLPSTIQPQRARRTKGGACSLKCKEKKNVGIQNVYENVRVDVEYESNHQETEHH